MTGLYRRERGSGMATVVLVVALMMSGTGVHGAFYVFNADHCNTNSLDMDNWRGNCTSLSHRRWWSDVVWRVLFLLRLLKNKHRHSRHSTITGSSLFLFSHLVTDSHATTPVTSPLQTRGRLGERLSCDAQRRTGLLSSAYRRFASCWQLSHSSSFLLLVI